MSHVNAGVIANSGDVTVTGAAIGSLGGPPAAGTPSWWGGTGVVNVATVGTVNTRTSSSPAKPGAEGTAATSPTSSWGGAARPSRPAGGGQVQAPAGLGVEISGPAQCLRGNGTGATGATGATGGAAAGGRARPQQAPGQAQGRRRVRRGVWGWLWQWFARPIHQAPDPLPHWLATLLLRGSADPSNTSPAASQARSGGAS